MCTLTLCVNKSHWEKGVQSGLDQHTGARHLSKKHVWLQAAWLAFHWHPLGCGKYESHSQCSGGGWTVWRMFRVRDMSVCLTSCSVRHTLLLHKCTHINKECFGLEWNHVSWLCAVRHCQVTSGQWPITRPYICQNGDSGVASSFNAKNHLLPVD